METSPSIAELAKALSKFQSEVGAVSKDGRNTFRNSRYATLANIWESISPALTENGLSLTQHPEGDAALTSVLMHTSGEWIRSTVTMLINEEKRDKDKDVYIKTSQTHGIAITYMRRYALSAILGIVTDDDDDGEVPSTTAKAKAATAASSRPSAPDMTKPPSPTTPRTEEKKTPAPSPAMKKMWGLLRTTKADLPMFRAFMREKYGHESTKDLSPQEVAEVIAFIEEHGPAAFQLDNDDNAHSSNSLIFPHSTAAFQLDNDDNAHSTPQPRTASASDAESPEWHAAKASLAAACVEAGLHATKFAGWAVQEYQTPFEKLTIPQLERLKRLILTDPKAGGMSIELRDTLSTTSPASVAGGQ